jgi:hypothetical protein
MKLNFILSGVALVAVAGAIVYAVLTIPVQATDAPKAAQDAQRSQNTPKPQNTPTASPVPHTPTQNAPATVAAMNMTAAADNVKAAQVQADAIRYAANAENTRTAMEAREYAARQAQSETGLNYRAELAVTQSVADARRAEAEAAIARAGLETRRMEADAQGRLIVGGLMIMVTGLFGAAFLSRRNSSPVAEVDDLPEYDTPLAYTWPMFAGGVRTGIFTTIASRDELRRIGQAIAEGRPFSHAQIVRGLGLMSEQAFDELQDAFIRYGLAEWRNADHHRQGVIITDAGRAFFAAITTHPPALSAPDVRVSRLEDTIRHENLPGGAGDTFTPL